MQLKIIKTDDGAYRIYLDETPLHHVKEYKIESSAIKGRAELSIKMLVQFPTISKNDSTKKAR